jgi:undecaprenyl-diphosphatase
MQWWQTIVLGTIEGLTEFLPVSSTGHLTIAENLMHLETDDLGVTAYTAVIQIGAIAAAVLYFRRDIVHIVRSFLLGLGSATHRQRPEWRLSLAVILGSIPIAIVGLAGKHVIETTLRGLWWVVAGLLLWSVVMVLAERTATQQRHEIDITARDGLVIGLAQCIALIPGVSRSGATISVGLMRGLDRVTATRMSFFLGIPALTAAGLLEAFSARADVAATVGWGTTLVGTVVAFAVAYASIAWLIRFVTSHSIVAFVRYRVALGVVLAAGLIAGVLTAS